MKFYFFPPPNDIAVAKNTVNNHVIVFFSTKPCFSTLIYEKSFVSQASFVIMNNHRLHRYPHDGSGYYPLAKNKIDVS